MIITVPADTSAATTAFLAEQASARVGLVQRRPDGSWLNQAEALLEAFRRRYLVRGSWCSREQMLTI